MARFSKMNAGQCSLVPLTHSWETTPGRLKEAVLYSFIGIAVLFVLQFLVVVPFVENAGERRTSQGYFALHTIANAAISVLTFKDLLLVATDANLALCTLESSPIPLALVASIHATHCLFYGLNWVDKLHHIVMIAVGLPFMFIARAGAIGNFCLFFICGVPGGIDYAMLVAVKLGKMKPIREKKINVHLNTWIRAPFLVISAFLCFVQIQQQLNMHWFQTLARFCCIVITWWNGQFFMERIVGNYHVNRYKYSLSPKTQKEIKRKLSEGDLTGIPLTDFDTDEHMLPPVMPDGFARSLSRTFGGGDGATAALGSLRRVGLSSSDLASLSASEDNED